MLAPISAVSSTSEAISAGCRGGDPGGHFPGGDHARRCEVEYESLVHAHTP